MRIGTQRLDLWLAIGGAYVGFFASFVPFVLQSWIEPVLGWAFLYWILSPVLSFGFGFVVGHWLGVVPALVAATVLAGFDAVPAGVVFLVVSVPMISAVAAGVWCRKVIDGHGEASADSRRGNPKK